MRVGIDFGTTRTVVSVVDRGNYPVCTFSWGNDFKEYIPSLVAVKNNKIYFGWDAVNLLEDPGTRLLRSIKRLAGRLSPDDPVELAPGLSLPLIELLTLFLRHVKLNIMRRSNLAPDRSEPIEAMVAVPANAHNNQRYMTLEAFRRAGFRLLGMVGEPSAAAVEFVHRYMRNLGARSPKKYVIVYDLGGGTFDAALVGLSERRYEILSSEGIARLGGDDFDRLIMEEILQEAGISPDDLDKTAEVRLLEECRERKEGLKPNTRKMVVDLEAITNVQKTMVIATERIFGRCAPLIEKSLDAVRSMLKKASALGIDPEDTRSLAAVYLVGGSVYFPPVSRGIRLLFDRKVKSSPFPHAATAIGLAVIAASEDRSGVREGVSRNFGVWREQENGREKVFDPIFTKDTFPEGDTAPIRSVRVYRPVHNIGRLRYLECSGIGDNGEPQGDITVWNEINFPYDPEIKDCKNLARLQVVTRPDLAANDILEVYSYDSKGMIRIEIENRTAGYRRVYTLGPGIPLS